MVSEAESVGVSGGWEAVLGGRQRPDWGCSIASRGTLARSVGSSSSGPLGEDAFEATEADDVVGGGDQVPGQAGAIEPSVARPSEAADRLHSAEDLLNGLLTNDKFCWSRPARLHLRWWRRALRDR